MSPLAVFRCDASRRIGGGHVMRCMALAHTLRQAGWRCTFASTAETWDVIAPPEAAGQGRIVLHRPDDTGELLRALPDGCALLVVDHYGMDHRHETAMRAAAQRILVIDDLADRAHDCDVLLDQTLGRDAGDYADLVPAHCIVLTGPRHALLRPDFAEARAASIQRPRGEVRRVLVAMGAGDPDGVTLTALEALAVVGGDRAVDVVLGRGSAHVAAAQALCDRPEWRVHVGLDGPAMADLMAQADLAIGAAGSSAWERCCLGLPTLMVVLADNQRLIAEALARAGAAVVVSADALDVTGALRDLLNDADRLRGIAAAAASVCDGLGVKRMRCVIPEPLTARDGSVVRLRLVEDEDRWMVFDWQQDPTTRRYARNPKPPTKAEHAAWFERKVSEVEPFFCIVESSGQPAGVLRLDPVRDDAGARGAGYEVSILVRPGFQGRGIALCALGLARRLMPDARLVAEVLEGNLVSARLFEAAGFVAIGKGHYVSLPARDAGCEA